jgi:hypothetical protein
MTALDSSSLKFWESIGLWGFIFVWVGVAGEGVEIFIKLFRRKLYERKKFCLDVIGAAFWVVLVVALAVEFLGNAKAMRIADSINSQLDAEAGQARKDAGAAIERAAMVESNNLVLRSNVLELQITLEQITNAVAKLQPRRLTWDQMDWLTIFLNGRDKSKDEPVKLRADHEDPEAMLFAEDISAVLWMGGIQVPEIEGFRSDALEGIDISFPSWGEGPPPPIALDLINGFRYLGFEPNVFKSLRSQGVIISVGGNRKRDFESKYVSMVFDGNGAIVRDFGVKKFFATDGVKISQLDNGGTHVSIEFTRSLSRPPFLFFLGASTNRAVAIGKQTHELSWQFDLQTSPPSATNRADWKCRLEVTP